MIVVSDTSAITSLIQVGRVEILARLYGEICIPQAVQNELLQTHPTLPEFLTADLEKLAGFRVADAVKQIIFREAGEGDFT